jgi:hypothetical protein
MLVMTDSLALRHLAALVNFCRLWPDAKAEEADFSLLNQKTTTQELKDAASGHRLSERMRIRNMVPGLHKAHVENLTPMLTRMLFIQSISLLAHH